MRIGTREIAPLDLEQKCEDYARNFVLADRDVTGLACLEKCGDEAETTENWWVEANQKLEPRTLL